MTAPMQPRKPMSMVKPPTPMKTYAPTLSEVDEVSAGGQEHPIQPISPVLSTKPGQGCYQIPALGSGLWGRPSSRKPAPSPALEAASPRCAPHPHLSYPHLPTVPLSFFSSALTRIEKTLFYRPISLIVCCLHKPVSCTKAGTLVPAEPPAPRTVSGTAKCWMNNC